MEFSPEGEEGGVRERRRRERGIRERKVRVGNCNGDLLIR